MALHDPVHFDVSILLDELNKLVFVNPLDKLLNRQQAIGIFVLATAASEITARARARYCTYHVLCDRDTFLSTDLALQNSLQGFSNLIRIEYSILKPQREFRNRLAHWHDHTLSLSRK
jgi:hypothetical protein